jgi:hypothetical protein
VLGCNDPGVEELAEYFGRDGWRLRQQPSVTMQVLDGADHTLGTHALRTRLIEFIRGWCRDSWAVRDNKSQRTVPEQTPGVRATSPLVRTPRNEVHPVSG